MAFQLIRQLTFGTQGSLKRTSILNPDMLAQQCKSCTVHYFKETMEKLNGRVFLA